MILKPGTTDYKRAKNAAVSSPRDEWIKIVTITKGQKAAVEAFAKSRGESVNGLVNALIRAEMGLSEEEWKKQGEG